MIPTTVRQRLQDYEFTDEQELMLTLELLKRIDKDVDELKAAKTREGFSLYVAIGGFAATLYTLLSELNKLSGIPFSKIFIIFSASILLIKIPWAINDLVTLDQPTIKRNKPGRFFWSNDFFFKNRLTGIFQSFIFLLSLVLIFFVPVPLWVAAFAGSSFLLYILIIGLGFILSIKNQPFAPNIGNKKIGAVLPLIFLIFTAVSVVGLILQMKPPVGAETQSYILSGLLLAAIFFVDLLIGLATPSLLLEKLKALRNDVVFLRTNLADAWTRYEVYVDGHDISEELRTDMDNIISCFNALDFHQSKKAESLAAIHEEIKRLQTQQELRDNDFEQLNEHRKQFFIHDAELTGLYEYLNPQLTNLGQQINRISRATQEWQRADEHHQFFSSRLTHLVEQERQLLQDATEVDEKLQKLLPNPASHKQDS